MVINTAKIIAEIKRVTALFLIFKSCHIMSRFSHTKATETHDKI